mgnify:CR=1 FL=1
MLVLCLLGLVQGLCEFLPVSSSGHLVLLSSLFGISDSLFVSIVLHLATMLAVIVVFRKDLWRMIRHPFSEECMNVYIATIPTCVIVLVLMPLVERAFGGGFLAVSFALSAALLFIASKKSGQCQSSFAPKHALLMGIAQGIAVFPGISRSGTTICAGLLSGAKRSDAAKFSFIMSLPVVLLSMLLEIVKLVRGDEIISVNVAGLVLGSIIAFVVGVLSIKLMMKLTERLNFKYFAAYLLFMAALTIFLI